MVWAEFSPICSEMRKLRGKCINTCLHPSKLPTVDSSEGGRGGTGDGGGVGGGLYLEIMSFQIVSWRVG